MKILAFNGSPRKTGNTATLLNACLRGAEAQGASVKLVNLYSLDYKGCTSCFSCKRIGGKSYGTCAMQDDLTPILSSLSDCDGLILGTPVYFGAESGETRSFMERLLFPFLTYTPGYGSLFSRKIPTALIYTMNVSEENRINLGYSTFMDRTRYNLERTFGACEMLLSTDTHQFSDYSKYLSTAFDPVAKAKRKEEVFPLDCQQAQQLGARLAMAALGGE